MEPAAPFRELILRPSAWAGALAWRDGWRRRRMIGAWLGACDAVVASHAKSGRTWLRAMVSHLYHRRFGIPEPELIHHDNFHRLHPEIPRILFWGAVDEAGRRWPDGLAPRQALVLLARDPLDVVVSFHQHLAHRATLKECARKGIRRGFDLAGLPLFDFARDERLGLPRIVRFLNAWDAAIAARPNGRVVRYEDLRRAPAPELARVIALLDPASAGPAAIEAAVAFGSFAAMREREAQGFFRSDRMRPGPGTGPGARKVREGRVGGHRDRFTAAERATLRAYVAAHLSPRLGYGRDLEDVTAAPSAPTEAR